MGINKVQYGNTTLIDLTSDTVTADKLMQGYTAHDRTGAVITGTATGGDNTLVVTVSWNETTEMWEPDKTFAEVQSAYNDGKTIVVDLDAETSEDGTADGEWDASSNELFYVVHAWKDGEIYEFGYRFRNGDPSIWVDFADTYKVVLGTIEIAQNGSYDVSTYESAHVNVAVNLENNKSVRITHSGYTDFEPSSGYVGISSGSAYAAQGSAGIGGTATYSEPIEINPAGSSITTYINVTEGFIDTGKSFKVLPVPYGSTGTPIATKGSVSNHSVSVTPSVTNSAGYITGGTNTGRAVSISASELVSGTKSISENGTGIDVTNYASVDVSVSAPEPSLQSKTKSYTPSETAQSETVTADSGYDGLSQVNVSVGAIDSEYIGSAIDRRSSSDVHFFDDDGYYVAGPSGFYDGNISVEITSGTAGTPTATKGTVSNHQVAVTPSVTNTTGYISGGTKNGTAVTVSASELVSGTYTVDSSGTKDVTNYASASVPAGTAGTPSASKGAVSNHSVSVTPSVTNQTGWITGSTKTGAAVTVTASELVSGSETKTENGTYDVTNLAELVVNVSGGGSVTWETIYDGNVSIVADSPNYVVINNWAPTHPAFEDGQTWRVTWNGTEYVCPTKTVTYQGSPMIYIGNSQVSGVPDTSNEPFLGYMRTATQLAFVTTDSAGSISLKMELQQDTSATLIEKTITANGTYNATDDDADGYSSVTVNVSSSSPTIQSLTVNPSTTQQTFNASGVDGYKPVTVNAMPSGTAGTPTATKGTVSNHSVSVTPSVTNQTGYITGGTKTGTAVTVTASELASGNKAITQNGTDIDVVGYSTVSVNVSGGIDLPTFTVTDGVATCDKTYSEVQSESYEAALVKVYVGGQLVTTSVGGYYQATSTSITYVLYESGVPTASITYNSNGTITLGNSAPSVETLSVSSNGTYDADYNKVWNEVVVNVPSGSSKNVQVLQSTSRTNSSSLTKVLGDLTVSKTGTYDVYWSGGRSNTSSSYTWGTRLYVDGSGYGTENTTWTNNCQSNHLSNVSLTANQKLSVYARGRTGSYYTFAPMLVIIEA